MGEHKAKSTAMTSASALRLQIESTLSRRVPSALTPAPKMMPPAAATGIAPLDDVLRGGLPIGAMSEMVGPECSGRTFVALSFLAQMTQAGKYAAGSMSRIPSTPHLRQLEA
jgi:recombination protein RecA